MTTMIERMAKAAWADYVGLGSFEKFRHRADGNTEDQQRAEYAAALAQWPNTGLFPSDDAFRSAARAALTALLDPTAAMAQAGADNLVGSATDDWSEDARVIWRAMIQAALDEKEG